MIEISKGEQLAVIGPNASGKSLLVKDFVRFLGTKVRHIAFRDTYGSGSENYYLQLRWNQMEIDEESPSVRELLDAACVCRDAAIRERLFAMLQIEPILDKLPVMLSSGETRKFLLAKALLAMPEILVLEDPFIGLDAPSRSRLSELMSEIVRQTDLTVVPVMSGAGVIPSYITHVAEVKDSRVVSKVPVGQYTPSPVTSIPGNVVAVADIPVKDMSALPFYPTGPEAEIVRCTAVSIRYGHRTILDNLNWVVREGESWCISGPNGSGKSTLLSLVCADNPQSYACNIELFSHRRGCGESIWEIKKHIGYVSPEMHRAYQKNISALDVVASGLFDTVGMFFSPDDGQYAVSRRWMEIFGIGDLAARSYLTLSSGEQRLCLLARAFVKDPELLILDEPMHGLDEANCCMVRGIIEAFMTRPHKTLLMVSHYREELPECIDHNLDLSA